MATSRSEVALSPSESGQIEINRHRLYWESHGGARGGTLLLLHHGLGSIRSWKRQIPAFIEAGWRVLAYDRWGYGRSDRRDRFQAGFLADDMRECLQLLDALEIRRCSIVGHSDGGSIALMLAAAHPERIRRMVVVAAHIYVEPKMLPGLDLIERQAAVEPLRSALEREHGDRADQLTRNWIRHWREGEPAELDLLPALPQIRCPTLVIQGKDDEHATDQHARDIAEAVPEAELWLIPEVSHMPPHQVPDEFNHRVLEFLGDPL